MPRAKTTVPVHLMPYLKRKDVAALLGVSVFTVNQMGLPWAPITPGGDSKKSRIFVVSRADLDAYLKAARGAVPE